jgi:hypothetical protein
MLSFATIALQDSFHNTNINTLSMTRPNRISRPQLDYG